MTIKRDLEQTGAAPISQEDGGSKLPKVTELKTQLVELLEQVVTLAVQSSKCQSRMPHCFTCNGIGHFQRQCPSKRVFWASGR